MGKLFNINKATYSLWNSNSSASATPLTFKKMQEAVKKVAKMKPVIHTHIVHPKALTDKRRRWAVCADCFEVLDLKRYRDNPRPERG